MGLFDAFRRPKPGGPSAMRARLEGAMSRRRLRGWQPPLENINSLVASGGPRLLARSRELVVTNGYAANACEAYAANLVGDGIKPSSLIEDGELRDRVQRLWLAWTDQADADGLTDFYGLQPMIAREMFVAGECFVRIRPRRAEDGLLVPFGDVPALAQAIVRLLDHPAERATMGARGEQKVYRSHTWEQKYAMVRDLYLRVVEEREG